MELPKDGHLINNSKQHKKSNNGNCYDLVFPALPVLKSPKTVRVDKKCTSPSEPSKVLIKSKTACATVNEVITISIHDKKSNEGEIFNEVTCKHICMKISREIGVGIEKFISKDKELILIISGKLTDVTKAKRMILTSFQSKENIVKVVMDVSPKHHRHFLGNQAEIIKHISEECQGVQISFPRKNSKSSKIVLKGEKNVVEKVQHKINKIVADLETRVTIEVIIPKKVHGVLIRNRELLENIRKDLNVRIKFPERIPDYYSHRKPTDFNDGPDGNRLPSDKDLITLIGKPENCERAKQLLLDSVPKTVDLNIPFDYKRSLIGPGGSTIREVSNNFNVHMKVENLDQSSHRVKITGLDKNIESAVLAIKEKMKLYYEHK